jgi:hypothetical protein
MGSLVLGSLLYWVANFYVNPDLLNDLMDGPLITVSFVVGIMYLTWSLFNCHRIVDGPFVLRLGICGLWLSGGVWRVSRLLYSRGIVHGSVGEHDALRGYMIAIAVMMGVLHIVALDMKEGHLNISRVALAALSIIFGVVWILAIREIAA